jgi:hypothetical protein
MLVLDGLKKDIIINAIQLGMSLYKAAVIAELNSDEIAALEGDETFQAEIEAHQAIQEKQLLERFNTAMEIAAEKGNTSPIQWMLSKINPEKWGEKKQELTIPGKLIITSDDEKLL